MDPSFQFGLVPTFLRIFFMRALTNVSVTCGTSFPLSMGLWAETSLFEPTTLKFEDVLQRVDVGHTTLQSFIFLDAGIKCCQHIQY